MGSGALISEDELIKQHRGKKTLFHLAKTPIAMDSKPMLGAHRQLYAWGFNNGGRPEGFWVAFGTEWLALTTDLDNPRYPSCCYLYEVKLRPRAKIINIRSERDFKAFDKKWPSYWVNLDYFDLDFTDYLTGNTIRNARTKTLHYEDLVKREGQTLKEMLIANKVIFTSAKEAERHCEFYKRTSMALERFKLKDWGVIAEKYSGIMFWHYDRSNAALMNYIWYQSLDIASGCIWDPAAIAETRLRYIKNDIRNWKKV